MSDYNNRPMTTIEWFLTIFVLTIPGVNLILYIVWACGVGNRNRVNFCRASILWCVLGVLIYFVLFSLIGIGAGLSSCRF